MLELFVDGDNTHKNTKMFKFNKNFNRCQNIL